PLWPARRHPGLERWDRGGLPLPSLPAPPPQHVPVHLRAARDPQADRQLERAGHSPDSRAEIDHRPPPSHPPPPPPPPPPPTPPRRAPPCVAASGGAKDRAPPSGEGVSPSARWPAGLRRGEPVDRR